jgi:hypothetical protein
MRFTMKLTTTFVVCVSLLALPAAAQTPRSAPEAAGISTERLNRTPRRGVHSSRKGPSAGAARTARSSSSIRKERVVAVLMTQTSTPGLNADFETAVMQSIVEPVPVH